MTRSPATGTARGGEAVHSIGLCVCEVCGTQSADHAGWFAIAGAGSWIEILPWTDDLLARSDCHHACCGDHLQKLVFSTAVRDLAHPAHPLSAKRGGWNPSSLVPPASEDSPRTREESILGVLNEIDAALQGPTEDEEDSPAFDA